MTKPDRPGAYGEFWNAYVRETFPRIQSSTPFAQRELASWRVLNTEDEWYEWPGDEWGGKQATARLLEAVLLSNLDPDSRTLCELGAGAGRYTSLVLERLPKASVLSFDVSEEFERVLRKRCAEHVASGRLRTFALDESPSRLLNVARDENLLGAFDAVYSFDAMVHVDLHTLTTYWANATKMLKVGGILSMNLANPCTEQGVLKLFHDAPGVYAQRGNAGGHFAWVSPEIVDCVLQRLGFEVSYPDGNGRDLSVCAKLVDPERAEASFAKAGGSLFRS